MDEKTPHADLVARLLARVMSRHDLLQAFLFGGDGEPFYAGRTPVLADEVEILDAAFDLIETLEKTKAKPFIGHDPGRRFSVTAISDASNLYLVCLNLGPDRVAAEQRIERVRQDLLTDLGAIERPLRLLK